MNRHSGYQETTAELPQKPDGSRCGAGLDQGLEAEIHRRAFLESPAGRGVLRVDSEPRGSGGVSDRAVCLHIVQEGLDKLDLPSQPFNQQKL
jgi:hypothetical protein